MRLLEQIKLILWKRFRCNFDNGFAETKLILYSESLYILKTMKVAVSNRFLGEIVIEGASSLFFSIELDNWDQCYSWKSRYLSNWYEYSTKLTNSLQQYYTKWCPEMGDFESIRTTLRLKFAILAYCSSLFNFSDAMRWMKEQRLLAKTTLQRYVKKKSERAESALNNKHFGWRRIGRTPETIQAVNIFIQQNSQHS